MSFYFGFTTKEYDFTNPERKDEDILFEWCGREHYELFVKLSNLGISKLISEDEYFNYYEYKIKVKDLAFIERLHLQTHHNTVYNTIMKLCYFDDNYFVQRYLDSLTIEQEVDYRLSFILNDVDSKITDICVELFEATQYGYDIIGALYEGYKKMIDNHIDEVWLFGG